MIQLRRMTQTEYEAYYQNAVQNLANEMAKANRIAPEETLCAAKKWFEMLLPKNDLNVPDQYLCNIFADGQKIGFLWFAVRRDRIGAAEVFVWEISIEPSSRKKGYGRQAMLALEDEARALGISRISLNVFAHNASARKLYDNLGYDAISSCMLKCL